MNANRLYNLLEKDFINPNLSDEWAKYMDEVKDYLSENFKKRSIGLVCDNSKIINKVYTAVFPTNEVMKFILSKRTKNALLFVHHPSNWDISKDPNVFQQMNRNLLNKFKENKISIYNLHVPLDNFGEYSTSNSLAKKLDIKNINPFGYYRGSLCGVYGKTDINTTQELSKKFKAILGHKIKLYPYGNNIIKNNLIAIVAGGGNDIDMLEDIKKYRINTFITGVTSLNSYSKKAHDFAKKNKINIIGGSHYSTEKFACIAMCDYFKKHGLDSVFIEGNFDLKDL
ncbi:MAG: Nif3-like dinuclear metal center hexameric protein [Candidatus Pacearchaeota archaeon]|jgi:putative NIF3 family GTP cyclohydrolase 1 type 2